MACAATASSRPSLRSTRVVLGTSRFPAPTPGTAAYPACAMEHRVGDPAGRQRARDGAVPGPGRYASQRLSTATSVQASCTRAGEDHHLPEGPEAQTGNARMAACAAVRSLAQMTRPAIADLPTYRPDARAAAATRFPADTVPSGSLTQGLDHHPDFGCEATRSAHRLPAGPRSSRETAKNLAAGGHRSMARSGVEELDATLQELARHSSSPRLPHEWKTA